MMPGNPAFGATVLRIPAEQSPNFVTGVSGWFIGQDGSAEFNDITIRGGSIEDGTALFYSPSPGLGNLVASVSAAAGVDSFGNHYVAGIASYGSASLAKLFNNGGVAALALEVTGLSSVSSIPVMFSFADNGGAANELQVLAISSGKESGNDDAAVQLFSESADATAAALAVVEFGGQSEIFVAKGLGIRACQPGTSTTIEAWHYPSLNSPFKSQTGWQKMGYKLMPDGTVALSGVLNLSTGTSWAGTIFTLPSGYIPSSKSGFAAGIFGATADGAPYLSVDTSGNVALTSVPAGVTAVVIGGRIPLDGTNA